MTADRLKLINLYSKLLERALFGNDLRTARIALRQANLLIGKE
jgi:hypothetical protein